MTRHPPSETCGLKARNVIAWAKASLRAEAQVTSVSSGQPGKGVTLPTTRILLSLPARNEWRAGERGDFQKNVPPLHEPPVGNANAAKRGNYDQGANMFPPNRRFHPGARLERPPGEREGVRVSVNQINSFSVSRSKGTRNSPRGTTGEKAGEKGRLNVPTLPFPLRPGRSFSNSTNAPPKIHEI
jgi:hypothetical protein